MTNEELKNTKEYKHFIAERQGRIAQLKKEGKELNVLNMLTDEEIEDYLNRSSTQKLMSLVHILKPTYMPLALILAMEILVLPRLGLDNFTLYYTVLSLIVVVSGLSYYLIMDLSNTWKLKHRKYPSKKFYCYLGTINIVKIIFTYLLLAATAGLLVYGVLLKVIMFF